MTLSSTRISQLGRPGLLMEQKLEYHLYFILRGNIPWSYVSELYVAAEMMLFNRVLELHLPFSYWYYSSEVWNSLEF